MGLLTERVAHESMLRRVVGQRGCRSTSSAAFPEELSLVAQDVGLDGEVAPVPVVRVSSFLESSRLRRQLKMRLDAFRYRLRA